MAADADTPDGELSDTDGVEPPPAADANRSENDLKDPDDPANIEDYDAESGDAEPAALPNRHMRLAAALGLVAVVALAAVVGFVGFQDYQSHKAQEQRELFVQVGRQGALNLTTIDWQHADTDVQRVLDSSTGAFYDDFSKRQQPFVEVVKKAQSKSTGTITEAGLESESGDQAQVLVAVTVKTSNLGAAEQEPRVWRMRISVEKVGDEAKVSNVAFVP
jgi:Mce-associated membrane protein